MSELWQPVVGWEMFYEVSSCGRVRSLDRTISVETNFGVHYRNRKGRILKPQKHSSGYLQATLSRSGMLVTKKIHELVLEAFSGPRPDGYQALHGPKGRQCNELDNLSWGTPQQNNGADKVRDRTLQQGEKHWMAKLTWNDIKKIRGDDRTLDEIGKTFNVSGATISRIKNGKTWKSKFLP